MTSVPGSPTADEVRANVVTVRDRIRAAGGDPDRVTLVAVTKAFPVTVAETALAAGLVDLGENYAQELVAKAQVLADPARPVGSGGPRWHFIGGLQSNKVKSLAPHVALWQTVDRASIAAAIGRHAPGAAVLVQVNGSGEPQKAGCALDLDTVAALVETCRAASLDVRGLMTVGAAGDRPRTREAFGAVRRFADRLELAECSMGMSADLEDAVREGSTMVRIGRDLFGARPVVRPGRP